MLSHRKAMMQDVLDSHKILRGKIRRRWNGTEFKNSGVDGIKIEVVSSVGATHEALKQAKVKIAKEKDLRNVPRSLETNSGVWEIIREWRSDRQDGFG